MKLPTWALLLISFAWTALQSVLLRVGVSQIVVDAIAAVLQHFGLLTGSKAVPHEELVSRAQALHQHCSGVACPPELKV